MRDLLQDREKSLAVTTAIIFESDEVVDGNLRFDRLEADLEPTVPPTVLWMGVRS